MWRRVSARVRLFMSGSYTHRMPPRKLRRGMYAGGDLLLFMGVFGLFALIPTGLAVYLLIRKFLTR